MQADVRDVHDGEHDRQRQRDRQRDHGPGSHTETHEAADEDDQDRLPERRHEVVDRDVDGDRLVGHQHGLDAEGQVGLDVGHLLAKVAAQRQDVAGIAHRDREPDRRLPVDAEHRLRRVDEATPDGGDIAQPEDAVAGHEVDRFEVLLGIERAGDAEEYAFLVGLNDAGRSHEVLRLQRGDDGRVIEPEAREPFGRELDVDLLVLRAQHVDLRDVLHLQQARARVLDGIAQFAKRETVGGERVDDAERVAEIVVEEGPDDAGGEGPADVADVLADLVPDVRNRGRRRRLLEVDEDRRLPGRRVAADPVQVVGLLQCRARGAR